jgi:ribokinase
MPGGRVLVVGAVNVDLVVAAARLPGPGQTVTGGDVARYPGGKGGNQATAAARLGARVAFVGAVGPDDMGSEARAALAVEGIDLTGLAVTDRATGVALIVVDPSGENLIAVAPGANGEVRRRHAEAALERLAPGPRDVVLVSREIPADGVLAALEIGREAGSTTILNPAPADDLEASTLALVDILTPNETELAILAGAGPAAVGPARVGPAGDDPGSLARRLLSGGLGGHVGGHVGGGDTSDRDADARDASGGTPGRGDTTGGGGTAGRRGPSWPAVVVTLGAAGALVVRIDGPALAVGAPDVTPLDTTGAGDAFNGALAAALADGLDLPEAVRRAVAAASLSTTRPGARGGMPTRAELEDFLGTT